MRRLHLKVRLVRPHNAGDQSVDVAVFCLALMGTDYPSFLMEAQRVLRLGGFLWIAEVSSRFQSDQGQTAVASTRSNAAGKFVKALQISGFKLRSTDARNKMFVVWELLKAKQGASFPNTSAWPALRACTYKKR